MQARHVITMSAMPSNTHATAPDAVPNNSRRGSTGLPSRNAGFGSVDMHIPLKVRNDVKKEHDEYPHHIDKMPVQRRRLVRLVRSSSRISITRHHADVHEHQQPRNYVRRMQRRNGIED